MLTGSALRFDIWKEDKDYLDWNKYIEYFRRESAFGEDKSRELERIYLFLKKQLGKDFLGKRYKDGRDLVNSWLWSRGERHAELKWLSDCLGHFKNKECNYIKLIGKLRSENNCNNEGIPFLITGDSLRKAGFDVVFEPETEFRSKPDLKIINPSTNEIIYGEISFQEESVETELIHNTFHFLSFYFHSNPPIIPFSGKILGFAENEDLQKIGKQILNIKEKAYNEESLIVVDKEQTEGILEFAVAHENKLSELKNLQLTKNYGLNEIRGQELNLDYTSRLLSKIKVKAKQHPENIPLIIYIPLDPLYFLFGLLEPYPMIDDVKRTLSTFKNVLGVCMFVRLGDEAEPLKELFELNFYQRKMIFENDTQLNTLFILNNEFDAATGVLVDSLRKLYTSFEKMGE